MASKQQNDKKNNTIMNEISCLFAYKQNSEFTCQNEKSGNSALREQTKKTSRAFLGLDSETEKRSCKKAKLNAITLPKIDQEYLGDDENGNPTYSKTLTYNNICFLLTPLHVNLSEHQIWKAKAKEKLYIIKTYHHLPGTTRQRDKILSDKKGYDKIAHFLSENKLTFFRLARFHTDPSATGFILAEYVEGDSEFSTEWSDNVPLTQLTPRALEILTQVRQLMELMWQLKTDLGDCRIENFIWKENQLIFIDYAYSDDSSLDDLSGHLNHYIASWAKSNPHVADFLYTNLKDLKELGWEGFIKN